MSDSETKLTTNDEYSAALVRVGLAANELKFGKDFEIICEEIQQLRAEPARLQQQVVSLEAALKDANDDLKRLDGACWHCLNPDSGDPERHDHNDGKFHWHHYIDPGDGLPSPCKHSELFERVLSTELDTSPASARPMHMYCWSVKPFFIAVAQAGSVAQAREWMLAQIGQSDGSCPEREKAYKHIQENTPEIWHGVNAEFELTDSAEVIEQIALCERLEKQIKAKDAELDEYRLQCKEDGEHIAELEAKRCDYDNGHGHADYVLLLKAKDAELLSLRSELESWKAANEKLAASYSATADERNNLRSELAALQADRDQLFETNKQVAEGKILHFNNLLAETRTQAEQLASTRAELEKLKPRSVVAAVIRTVRGDYIIGQRMPEQWMAGKWCFVGGKVESGESLEDAVRREVLEEIGISVQVERLRHQQIEKYEHGTFLLHYFDCLMDDGQIPQLLDCANTASVSPERLPAYDLLPVDIDIAKQIALESSLQRMTQALLWISTVNDALDLRKFDAKTIIGLIYEMRSKAKAALPSPDLQTPSPQTGTEQEAK